MQRTGIALDFGSGPRYEKFTIGYAELSAAALTKDITLFTLPRAGKILGVFVKHSVAFGGGSISAVSVSVGKSGSTTFFTSAFDILQAVADTTVQETALFKGGQLTALPIVARFTSVTANLSALTAGSVDIYVLYLPVSTPSA